MALSLSAGLLLSLAGSATYAQVASLSKVPVGRVSSTTSTAAAVAGGFSAGFESAVGANPHSVALGDVDGDGDLDFVTANQRFSSGQDGTVSVRLNTGKGNTFTTGPDVSVGSRYPNAVVLGDVDGDGDLDFVTANNSGAGLTVGLNNGSASFSATADARVGSNFHSIALGDLDRDGDLDIVAGGTETRVVAVLLNNGKGVFSRSSSVSVGLGKDEQGNADANYVVALGDLDGDGDLDIAAANINSDNSVSIRLNNGAGSFSGNQKVSVGSDLLSVVVADVDKDGDLDMLTANEKNVVSVRYNQGDGSFSGNDRVTVGEGAASLTVGDIDGDGDLDLATANAADNTVSVRLNDGRGNFSGTQEVAVGKEPVSVKLGDVDGDGDVDLLTTNNSFTKGTVSVRLK